LSAAVRRWRSVSDALHDCNKSMPEVLISQ
jgi:hypothetical protein